MNCKTESYFFIMFSVVGCVWIRDGPHAGRGLRTSGIEINSHAQIQSHVEKLIQRRFRVQTDPKHTENATQEFLKVKNVDYSATTESIS